MPPKRPRAHINADRSVARISELFISAGWTAEELGKDYGEDLLVRIFDKEEATQYAFFVQVKSREGLVRYRTSDGNYIRFQFSSVHLHHWDRFWEPVILIVWDSTSNIGYWEVSQSPEKPAEISGQRARVFIPTDNVLDQEGLDRIASRARRRHARFEVEKQGAQVLVQMLQDMLEVKIEYNPQAGILIVTQSSGEKSVTIFGPASRYIEQIEKLMGRPIDEAMFNDIVLTGTELATSNEIIFEDPEGNITRWSPREFMRHAIRKWELEE